MNRSTPSFRRLFSFTLLVFLLVSCGGKAESDFDVLKKEGEASGEEIPVGTYDSKNIVFANETQAATYFYKEWGPNGNGNYNYHAHNENIYFFTSSYETIDATFPSTGNRP